MVFFRKLEGARETAYLRQVIFQNSNSYLNMKIFEKFLRDHVWTVPGNMHVKFEVRSFNRFGAISINNAAARTHTHTYTHTQSHRMKTVSPSFTPFT